jgi:16S rRNA (cytosine967-C5)-methyltransferase
MGHPENVEAFAERLGHPAWLVERWVKAYGRDAVLKICEADQLEHGVGGMFAEVEGDLPVMDDGSRLVAEIAAAAVPGGLDHSPRVWDCCAAPGGKTLILAKRLPEAEVLATDVSAKRLAQMRARMKRFEYAERVKCSVMDATAVAGQGRQPTPSTGSGQALSGETGKDGAPGVVAVQPVGAGEFDLILCDVPCSGTGTLAGNPEIRHFLKLEEFQRQSVRQKKILIGALARLAKGGRLVYSTCSLEREECEDVVEAVMEEGGFRRVAVEGLMEKLELRVGMESAVRDGVLRTLPGVHGCDGFFAVVLERV